MNICVPISLQNSTGCKTYLNMDEFFRRLDKSIKKGFGWLFKRFCKMAGVQIP